MERVPPWKRVFSQYVDVSADKPFAAFENPIFSIKGTATARNSHSKRLPRSTSTYKIEHEKPLYNSVVESQAVLDRNKAIYERVTSEMKRAE